MIKKAFIKMVRAALSDEEIYNKLGDLHYIVVRRALEDALTTEMLFEDGKSEPGRIVEKSEKVNLIKWLAKYIPSIEGALRGLQADVDVARNRAVETRDIIANMAARELTYRLMPSGRIIETKLPEITD